MSVEADDMRNGKTKTHLLNPSQEKQKRRKQFHSRPGNQKLPLAAAFTSLVSTSSSTHSLGWGKTHRLFSYDGKVHPHDTKPLSPDAVTNTEKKWILFLVEVGMLPSIEILQSCFPPVDTRLVYLSFQNKKIQCMLLSMRPKRDSG